MSKIVNCQTVICRVNGVTLLDLSLNSSQNITIDEKIDENSGKCEVQTHLDDTNEETNEEYVQQNNDNDVDVGSVKADNSDDESRPKARILPAKGIYEMEMVDTSIESVRQYVLTTRKDGKVWHMCRWAANPKDAGSCEYGSKWSGAMVNHIRSHLGIKPFRCLYCDKLFTIACNLKNHLRSHHGLKAKIILNGGRNSSKSGSEDFNEEMAEEVRRRVKKPMRSSKRSVIRGRAKHRIFKPSLINGKDKESRYNVPQMERRTLPKRNVKKNQKYVDFQEDFEEEEDFEPALIDSRVDEAMAEEENRKFYQKTEEEEAIEETVPEDNSDDTSRFVVKRKYNKKVWFVCVWNPRQCKYRSHVRTEVLNHVKKHQNIRQFICNWNHCSASFVNRLLLESHQQVHKKQKYFKCNFPNCGFQTINETAIKMHKIRHKRHH